MSRLFNVIKKFFSKIPISFSQKQKSLQYHSATYQKQGSLELIL